jgi:DNA-binding NarL/FixJ family response regulator
MDPIRVMLVEDHAVVRAGFHALLRSLPDVEVVGEASNGREALEMVPARRPDVLLTDISMPELSGLQLLERMARDWPKVRVILLSMHANEEYVLKAVRDGAAGYLPKDADPAELEIAIKAVARGETYLSPAVSKHVVTEYVHLASDRSRPPAQLTARQSEILQMIAEGQTTKEIARRLQISVKTVETHRTQLMERLDIHDIAGLVRYAIRTGLINPDA